MLSHVLWTSAWPSLYASILVFFSIFKLNYCILVCWMKTSLLHVKWRGEGNWKLSVSCSSLLSLLSLKCPYHQNFYIPIWSYISCNDLSRKKFSIWIKSDFLWSFKNLKILFCCGLPVPLITSSTCSDLWRRLKNTWLKAWLIWLVLPL